MTPFRQGADQPSLPVSVPLHPRALPENERDWNLQPSSSLQLLTSTQVDRSTAGALHLLDESEIANLPKLDWLVDEWLPKHGLALLYGPSGCGKSFVALDWALSVASGLEWLSQSTAQGSVVYVWAEARTGLNQRLEAWKLAHEVRTLPAALFMLDAPQFHDERQVTAFLASLAKKDPNPALIIVDTLARCFVGGEENSARDVGLFMAGLTRIIEATEACVLVIHHTGRSGDSERGSTALRAAVDTAVSLSRKGETLRLSVDKQRDSSPPAPIPLRLIESGESCAVEACSSEQRPKAGSLTAGDIKCLKALLSFYPNQSTTHKDWYNASGQANSTFDRCRQRLMDRKYVGFQVTSERYFVTETGKIVADSSHGSP